MVSSIKFIVISVCQADKHVHCLQHFLICFNGLLSRGGSVVCFVQFAWLPALSAFPTRTWIACVVLVSLAFVSVSAQY